jgi:hypothetical protein
MCFVVVYIHQQQQLALMVVHIEEGVKKHTAPLTQQCPAELIFLCGVCCTSAGAAGVDGGALAGRTYGGRRQH